MSQPAPQQAVEMADSVSQGPPAQFTYPAVTGATGYSYQAHPHNTQMGSGPGQYVHEMPSYPSSVVPGQSMSPPPPAMSPPPPSMTPAPIYAPPNPNGSYFQPTKVEGAKEGYDPNTMGYYQPQQPMQPQQYDPEKGAVVPAPVQVVQPDVRPPGVAKTVNIFGKDYKQKWVFVTIVGIVCLLILIIGLGAGLGVKASKEKGSGKSGGSDGMGGGSDGMNRGSDGMNGGSDGMSGE